MDNIEEALRELILAKYETMVNFSAEIGMSNSTLASIINRGIHKASVNNIIKICKALNISADALANGQIKPLNNEISEKWQFKDMSELAAFIKITLTTNELTINGEPLTQDDIQDMLDQIELSCEFIRRKHERKQ